MEWAGIDISQSSPFHRRFFRRRNYRERWLRKTASRQTSFAKSIHVVTLKPSNSATNRFSQEAATTILSLAQFQVPPWINSFAIYPRWFFPASWNFFVATWSIRKKMLERHDHVCAYSFDVKPDTTINIAKIVAYAVGEATTWLYSEVECTIRHVCPFAGLLIPW